MLSKRRKVFSLVLFILFLVTLVFIWSNSLQSIPSSKAESLRIGEIIEPILEPIVGDGDVTDHLVRKMAHFVEFFALGCELIGLSLVRGQRGWKTVGLCLFVGLIAASIDETIQIFSNRGAQVQDVLLDLAGVTFGVSLTLLARWCILLFCSKIPHDSR